GDLGSPAHGPGSRSGCRCRRERSRGGTPGRLGRCAWLPGRLTDQLAAPPRGARMEQGLFRIPLEAECEDALVSPQTGEVAPEVAAEPRIALQQGEGGPGNHDVPGPEPPEPVELL